MSSSLKRFVKAIAFILLLLGIVLLIIGFYGQYLPERADRTEIALQDYQETSVTSGNGFGGDAGMHVLDSGYRVDIRLSTPQYFWIDDKHLLFIASQDVAAMDRPVGHFLWNTQSNAIKPLDIEGRAVGYSNSKLRFFRLPEGGSSAKHMDGTYRYQATLRELPDKWILENIESMDLVIGKPPDRYEIAWTSDQRPWFRLSAEVRTEKDVPDHRFKYLWEWGWIMRTPAPGAEHHGQLQPWLGFFDIGGNLYGNQEARKIANLVDLPLDQAIRLAATYIVFLDMYWIASAFPAGDADVRFMGLLSHDGSFRRVEWPASWPDYGRSPLPTKKGLFWSGPDFRLASPTRIDVGAFIRSADDQVLKVVHGFSGEASVSDDGCRIAFFNVPRIDKGSGSLKVANVCTSTKDGSVLRDVDY